MEEDHVSSEREAERRRKECELEKKLQELPHLPQLKEDGDVEAYLAGFERQMQELEYREEEWMTQLQPLLSDWALAEVEVMPTDERGSYSR